MNFSGDNLLIMILRVRNLVANLKAGGDDDGHCQDDDNGDHAGDDDGHGHWSR